MKLKKKKQSLFFKRFFEYLDQLSRDELDEARKARGSEMRFSPYKAILYSRIPAHKVNMYYLPFDFVNLNAKVVILGISPDYYTMYKACSLALKMKENKSYTSKEIAIQMMRDCLHLDVRAQLVTMLDGIGLGEALGVGTFGEFPQESLHLTSVIHYPAFIKGEHYCGQAQGLDLMSAQLLKEHFIQDILADELSSVPNSLVIPLGDVVSDVLLYLIKAGMISYKRCLVGFPNPSKFHRNRLKDYSDRRFFLEKKVRLWKRANDYP